ncbi:MAG: DUF2141 domain-containing protein [Pseudomonadota bacterium]
MNRVLCSLLFTSSLAIPCQAADLELHVINITELKGMLFWALFDSEEGYSENTSPVMSARNRVQAETLTITLHDLPEGRYAVRLFHDANGNGELDSNMLGIPKEGYGFSNGAGKFGPASYEDAAVDVAGDAHIEIRLR